MSNYMKALPVAVAVGYATPDTKYVVWMSEAKAEMQTVFREGSVLNADISAYQSQDPSFVSFKNAWSLFWSEYQKFQNEKSDDRFFGAAEIYDRSVNYGKSLNDWRARFLKFPGAKATEPDVVPDQYRQDPRAINWIPIAIGGIAVVGIIGGGYVLAQAGTIGSMFARLRGKTA